ncbi:MerR family DNA-binding transcriptional regulator [Pseudolysinimonas sp.]|uniref:MerR family DNA-binding transcriptional regulator n=1 Tax=Pseudolysinimonas sp. TaxID=2680009 RepID=UPI00378415B6
MLIGELSRRSGVSTRSLRYYEQHDLIAARRTDGGYREYDDAAIDRAATIHLLFGMGFPREIVASVVNCSGPAAGAAAHADLERRLPEVLDDLDRRIGTMTQTRAQIAAFLADRSR